MIKKLCYTILILFFASPIFSQQKSLIGTVSPEIHFEKVLNDKISHFKLSDFKGKIVLIDFWATWCVPCIQSFPKIDSLQQLFPNDLKTITVTSESETRIVKFLEKFKTGLPIALDTSNKLKTVFPYRTVPHTILIDKKGVIRVVSTSSTINKNVIEELLNDKSIDIPEKNDNLDFDPQKSLTGAKNVLGQITLTPFLKNEGSASTVFRNGRMSFKNLLPSTIYERLFDFPLNVRSYWAIDKERYKFSEKNLYCLEIIAPDKTEPEAKQLLINYLQASIPLKARVVAMETDVKILTSIENNSLLKKGVASEKSSASMSRNGFEMINSPINSLSKYLEEKVDKPVVDETNLSQNYNLTINWFNENPNQIYAELQKLGLKLVDGKRKIAMLVFYEEKKD